MDSIRKQQGDFAEELVYNYFNYQGLKVEMSEDPYDQDKDMIVDGKTVEIKSLTMHWNTQSYRIPKSQLRKISNVDRLIIVSMPHNYANQNKAVIIKEVPKEFRTREHLKFEDNWMYIFNDDTVGLTQITHEATVATALNFNVQMREFYGY